MPSARTRAQRDRRTGLVETVCVVAILLAVVALVAWIVLSSGGGVINQG